MKKTGWVWTRCALALCAYACAAVAASACSEVPKYRPADGGGSGGNGGDGGGGQGGDAADAGGERGGADASSDAVDAIDATCTCSGGFACVAGTCKTTCATSTDCHADYFCDSGNHGCHSDVVSVAVGANHVCAALKDGRVVCWGDNGNGQLGTGMLGVFSENPVPALVLSDALAVRASEYGTCAMTGAGKVYCWGIDNFAGTGHDDPAPVAIRIGTGELTGVTRLAVGFTEMCVVAGPSTYCWKSGMSPTVVSGAGEPSSLAVGYGEKVVSYGDTRICPWDADAQMPLPQGQCFTGGAAVAEVVAGEYTSYARLQTGVVIAWGSNGLGALGAGQDDTLLSGAAPPGVVVTGLNARRVVAGQLLGCALSTADRRSVYCWGQGTQSTSPLKMPLTLEPGLEVTDLGSGVHAYAACAIISDGSLQCWRTERGLMFSAIQASW